MRIAVNTRLLLKDRLEGIGWFTFESLKRITTRHPEHEFIFMFDRPFSDEFIFSSNIKPVVFPPPSRHPFLWYCWFEYSVPYLLKKHKADLFLSTDGFLSLSSSVPSLAVIHDINFIHRPFDLPLFTRKYYNHYFPLFASKAVRIGTVSEYSKQDIIAQFGIPSGKIDVMYNGSHDMYTPISEEKKKETREEYSKGSEYFIFIGSLHPRKNVTGLLQAFDLFKKSNPSNIKMVIVGDIMFKGNSIIHTHKTMKHRDDVIFTGRLKTEKLRNVLGSALAMTFVPFFEGFGIPVVEAMHCDVPVICSDITSLPEVGGDAVLYVNPLSVESIKNGMEMIARSKGLQKELIEKSRVQRKKFSWDKTADNLWRSICKCTGSGW